MQGNVLAPGSKLPKFIAKTNLHFHFPNFIAGPGKSK